MIRATISSYRRQLEQYKADADAYESAGWMISGCNAVWRGEHAEIDTKAEAMRCGGTCINYEIFKRKAK